MDAWGKTPKTCVARIGNVMSVLHASQKQCFHILNATE